VGKKKRCTNQKGEAEAGGGCEGYWGGTGTEGMRTNRFSRFVYLLKKPDKGCFEEKGGG